MSQKMDPFLQGYFKWSHREGSLLQDHENAEKR